MYYGVFPSSARVCLASDFPFNLHPEERSTFRRAKEQPQPGIVLRVAFRDGFAIHYITSVVQAPHIAEQGLST